jgi:hypothetical protein
MGLWEMTAASNFPPGSRNHILKYDPVTAQNTPHPVPVGDNLGDTFHKWNGMVEQ